MQGRAALTITMLLSTSAWAQPAKQNAGRVKPRDLPVAASAPRNGLSDLEVQVWTADESQLPHLEREAARIIQMTPNSAAAHHLLSHIQVRLFSKDPGDLYLLKQASDLAKQAV